MAVPRKKRPIDTEAPLESKKSRSSTDTPHKPSPIAGPSKPKPSIAPRPAPSFLSALKDEDTDFPRGGGSSLTPFEQRQIQAEGRKEADAEVEAEVSW